VGCAKAFIESGGAQSPIMPATRKYRGFMRVPFGVGRRMLKVH
jgi:hypothetical protein